MSQEPPEPVYDRNNPRRSGAELVQFHLRQFGLGEWWMTCDGKPVDGGGTRPAETGWCRAVGLSEAAWPTGAELCVIVDWFPGSAFMRNDRTGSVPHLADQHWRSGLADTADALESHGFVVERNGPPQGPEYNGHAELLVYRMPDGVEPTRLPADTWAGTRRHPPNFKDGHSWYPGPDPVREVGYVLSDASLTGTSGRLTPHPQQGIGRCNVIALPQLAWPYGAELCALVRWYPDKGFARATGTGVVPDGAADHWSDRTAHIVKALEGAGYQVRRPERPQGPRTDEHADFVAYRVKT